MNTSKPIIDFHEILSFFRFGDVHKFKIPKGYDSYQWQSNGASSIASVINQLKNKINSNENLTILIPGYFCGQSLRYLRSLDVEIVFYPLTKELEPDFNEIKELIKHKSIDVFMLVHYFGRVSCQSESRTLADELDFVLIEDCAHVASPHGSEWIGDFVIFSPHKHLPLPEIGIVLLKNSEDSALRINSSIKGFPILWLLKQTIKKLIKYSKAPTQWNLVWNSSKERFIDQMPNKSSISSCIELLKKSDSNNLACNENIKSLKEILLTVKDWEVFPSLNPDSCPTYLVGMKCINKEVAKRRMSLLNADSQLVMQWPDLPQELVHEPAVAEQAIDWVSTVIFFFVHHKIDKLKLIEGIDKVIKKEGF